jgi:hypothetical protein
MDEPFIIPLAVFAMVALIVAIMNMVKIRELEMDVRQRLYQEELEHRRKMSELDSELHRLVRSSG